MDSLNGKIALVTGGSRGIGRGISERLAADGALVAVHYGSDESAAAGTVAAIEAAGGHAFAVRAQLGSGNGDVATLFDVLDRDLLARTGATHIDNLDNNAGISAFADLAATSPELYDELFAINTRAPFFIAQAATVRMGDGGRIIAISSGVTQRAQPTLLAYSMSKAALDVMGHTLAKELAPRGIAVNTVAASLVDTDMNAAWLRTSEEAKAQAASVSAFNRLGEPRDIADVVAFIASDDARFITGHYLDATGGSLL